MSRDEDSLRLLAPPAARSGRRLGFLAALALVPGFAVLGFRAMIAALIVCVAHELVGRLLRRRGGRTSPTPTSEPHLVSALLLTACLPVSIAGGATAPNWRGWLWPLMFAAPILLALLRWVRSSCPRMPFDAVALTAVLLHVVTGPAMWPNATVDASRVFRGDVLNQFAEPVGASPVPWHARTSLDPNLARATPWAAEQMDRYLSRSLPNTNLDSLMRDHLPPIEDLVLMGHPMPIGMCSGIALLTLVLWGAFHRTLDWRIPLAALAACYVMLVVLPVPSSVTGDQAARWRWLGAAHVDIGPATALTFVHYVLFASPTLFAIGLLATRGDNRPVQPRAILPWSVALGAACAGLTLYVSVLFGPFLAVVGAPLAARLADRLFARRPLAVAT